MLRFTIDGGGTGPVRQPHGALCPRMSQSGHEVVGAGWRTPPLSGGIDGIAAPSWLSFPRRARTIATPCLSTRLEEAILPRQCRTHFISGFAILNHVSFEKRSFSS